MLVDQLPCQPGLPSQHRALEIDGFNIESAGEFGESPFSEGTTLLPSTLNSPATCYRLYLLLSGMGSDFGSSWRRAQLAIASTFGTRENVGTIASDDYASSGNREGFGLYRFLPLAVSAASAPSLRSLLRMFRQVFSLSLVAATISA